MREKLIEHSVAYLTEDEPEIDELRALHRELCSTHLSETPVEQYALAAVVGSILEYLDFVGTELEKSIGIRRADERQRIFNELTYPSASNPYLQVEHVVGQWENFDQYTYDEIDALVAQANEPVC